ncbi:MAG: mandelate racemase/muconate lactonizing enzyme family protein [Bryobacterales bacterium]|nr:mandelate racemase/muconate lactonizing enzyme family protein [Bryobacterales bacterium]
MVRITRKQLLNGVPGLAGLATLPLSAAGKSERLKITKIDFFQVVVPIQPDIINSPEFDPDSLSEFPKGPKIIVRLRTDSGLFGIGESPRNVPKAGALENARHLEGQNALDLNLPRLKLPNRETQSAYEIALYDVIGKAFGWPVYQLLGGLAQDKVYVPYWCGRKNPVDAERVAQRTLKGGFTSLKMKGRPGDPIVEAVRAVKEVAPDVKITVDFNRHYKTAEEFLPIGRALDRIGNMRTIEDPVDDLGEMAKIAAAVQTAITLTPRNARHMVEAAKLGSCKLINTGPSPSMMSFVTNAALAGALGMPCWHGSGHELGIKDAAMVHSCAAAGNCTLPSDILSYQRVDDLIVNPIPIKDSHAIVPRAPGLGVELDEDAVAKYSA